MKLRHPLLIKMVAWLGAWIVRCWISTLRYRFYSLGPDVDPHRPNLADRYIYAFWHEHMLVLAYQYAQPDIRVLISHHADGQLIAEICRRLGFGMVRGSTNRRGTEAALQMLRLSRQAHLAITPDGPRGPRRTVQEGLVFLAARTGLPIVPVGIGYDRPWRLKSWDRFAIPRPWRRARAVAADPIAVPANADRLQLGAYRQRVELALHQATDLAERWATSGSLSQVSSPNYTAVGLPAEGNGLRTTDYGRT